MENEIELKQIVAILLKRWWLILVLPVIAALAAFYFTTYFVEPVYQSGTTLYVINKNTAVQNTIAYNDLLTGQQLVKDYRELIVSRRVTGAVISELRIHDITPEALASKLNIKSKNDTRVIEIVAEDTDPQRAARIADKVGEIFIKEAIALMKVDNIEIIDGAIAGKTPVKPNVRLNVMVAFVLGFFAACGIAFLIEYLDDTIKTPEDVEKHLGLAVLGTIPEFNNK